MKRSQLLKDYSDAFQHKLYSAIHGGYKSFAAFFQTLAEGYGYKQEIRDGWFFWFREDGSVVCAVVYLIDNRDLSKIIDVYDTIIKQKLEDVFVIVMEDNSDHIYYDMYRLWSTSYLEHHNQGLPSEDTVMPVNRQGRELLPQETGVIHPKCYQLFNDLAKDTQDSWNEAIANGFNAFAAKLEPMATEREFSQETEGQRIIWREGPRPVCTFQFLPSPDSAQEVRDCFDFIARSGCFLGFIITRMDWA
jgi:hypothetical protein